MNLFSRPHLTWSPREDGGKISYILLALPNLSWKLCYVITWLFISNGIGVLTYFGHSSASTLGFNLDDPSVYTNQSKYPVMYVNGCYAGNYFTYDPARVTGGKTLSENYVFIKNKGA